ncbi:MAG TPA: FUSC family protein [Candidatus Luteococcus avicola]|nr:FUSC family protein [Candidatus Luteococcus avicola]
MQASAAVSLTLAVLTGVLVGSLDHPEWVTVLVAALIAATGDVIARANSYHPPGPLFMVFAFGTIAAIPQHVDDLWVAALVCGGSALFSMLVGVAGVALRPGQLRTVWQEAERLRASVTGSWKPLGLALSVVLAGSTAIALGIGHPYWAMIAAVAPMTAPHVTMQVTRGIQRTMGTTVGLVLAWILLAPHLSPWWTVVVVALLQFITELVVGRKLRPGLHLHHPDGAADGHSGAPHRHRDPPVRPRRRDLGGLGGRHLPGAGRPPPAGKAQGQGAGRAGRARALTFRSTRSQDPPRRLRQLGAFLGLGPIATLEVDP